jgi:DNA-binding transcriptional LysR family regulator
MQVQQLAYFVAVADERHFTRAARAVHVAQPSLSKQVAALEAELGCPLFSRARGNIGLTAAGEALLPLARRILADVDTAQTVVRELVGLQQGRVRLGATPSLSTVLVPQALRRFHDRYPGVRLVLEEGGSRDLVAKLAQGALDLALIILPLHTDDPALQTFPVLREPLVAAVPHDHPLAERPTLRISDLRDVPLVMFREGYDLRDVTLAACRKAGFEPRFAVEGGEMDAVVEMVRAGLGVAIVPSMVASRLPQLSVVPFSRPAMTRTVALAHRMDVGLSNAAGEFAREIRELVGARGASGALGGARTAARSEGVRALRTRR